MTGSTLVRIAAVVVVLLGVSCHTGPSVPSELGDSLPASAKVFGVTHQAVWGNVVVVTDSTENMTLGPPVGATETAVQYWLSVTSNRQKLTNAGWNAVLTCNSGVNSDDSGVKTPVSEMVSLDGASSRGVKTGQSTNTDSATTIECSG